MRTQFKNQKELNDYVDEYKELLDEAYAGQGDVGEEFKDRMESAYNLAITGELGSDLQIRTNPTGYYTDEEGKVTNTPQTTGQALTMAENLTFADIENSNLGTAEKRRLGAALMEARALAADNRTTTDATGQMVSKLPPGTPILPIPGPGPLPKRPGPIDPPPQQPSPPFVPFPSTGIASIFDPRFMGPNFDPRMSAYARQGLGDRRFDQFYRNLEAFPVV